MTKQPAEFLEWDSGHFGCRVGRCIVDRMTEANWSELQSWRRQNSIDCLYLMADAADNETIRLAQRDGFDLVETRIAFERRFTSPPAQPAAGKYALRLARQEDEDELAALTKGRFLLSRFHADRCFDKERVEDMYQLWIRQSVAGDFDDAVLVVEAGQELLGYVTCRLNEPPGTGKVGLHCVGESAQGKGIGTLLMRYASWWFYQQGMHVARSVTQAPNIGSQISLQRTGYVTRAAGVTFHKWIDPCPDPAP